MTNNERASELKSIASHLDWVLSDLASIRDRLSEELRCSAEAKRIDTIVGKLYETNWTIHDKANRTK